MSKTIIRFTSSFAFISRYRYSAKMYSNADKSIEKSAKILADF